MKTETADSGHEAIEQFLKSKENKRPYDAIVLDTHLYNPSGLDVAKKIRSEKPRPKSGIGNNNTKKKFTGRMLKNSGIRG